MITALCSMPCFGSPAAALPGGICRNAMAHGAPYPAFAVNGWMMAFSTISFVSSAWKRNWKNYPWTPRLFKPTSIAQAQKRGPENKIGHSRGGASTKIHAVVDAYGYPVYFQISKCNDSNYVIPVLAKVSFLDGSQALADRSYDSYALIDYIYSRGNEPTIPSRKGDRFERQCDWWLHKERHLVERYFFRLQAFRRIATRYDKLAFTYLGFIYIASILIWLK